ncbi:MAG TPA: class I SAM-dependent methyltransferase [Ilumatobacteraceae bacterium]
MDADARRPLHEYYELGLERDRLDDGVGALEFARTKEIVSRHLPLPCAVADIGGGPGRYTVWLAELGCRVHHRDLVPLHVEQAAAAAAGLGLDGVDTAVGDALDLDLSDAEVDAVLLLGPLYHLSRRDDRLRALREAHRVVRPGGVIFVAAISRWAARVHGVLADQLYLRAAGIVEDLTHIERTGELRPLFPGSFNGYGHRPRQLTSEVRAAGLDIVDLVSVEGPAALLSDLPTRLHDPLHAEVVFETARALERVPELLGIGPHLIVTARRPSDAR